MNPLLRYGAFLVVGEVLAVLFFTVLGPTDLPVALLLGTTTVLGTAVLASLLRRAWWWALGYAVALALLWLLPGVLG